jgi:hypothetical protein
VSGGDQEDVPETPGQDVVWRGVVVEALLNEAASKPGVFVPLPG